MDIYDYGFTILIRERLKAKVSVRLSLSLWVPLWGGRFTTARRRFSPPKNMVNTYLWLSNRIRETDDLHILC